MTMKTELSPSILKSFFESSGDAFTDLIGKWARAYVPVNGGTVNINRVANRGDGGIDGYIDLPDSWNCPFGFEASRSCVLQFKAGAYKESDVEKELPKEAKDGKRRIRDDILDGRQVLWFIGTELSDGEIKVAETHLNTVIKTINSRAPKGIIVDLNRLVTLFTFTPVIAIELLGFFPGCVTSATELKSSRHNDITVFVAPPGQSDFEVELETIATSLDASKKLTYRYGAPGTGKSRRVLEAVERNSLLSGTTLYFRNPIDAKRFLAFVEEHKMSAVIIIDDYLEDSTNDAYIGLEDIPDSVRCILIGHGKTILSENYDKYEFTPLGAEDLYQLLKNQHPKLPEGAIRHHIREARTNIRLAHTFCIHLGDSLEILEPFELLKAIDKDKRNIGDINVFLSLSLLHYLESKDRSAYCLICNIDEKEFVEECRKSSASNMLIQHNEHVSYIGCNRLAQLVLIDAWRQDRRQIERILNNPSHFRGKILDRLKELPEGSQKAEMLAHFKPAIEELTLTSMANGVGRELVPLLLATPEEYFPIISKCILDAGDSLTNWFYEGEVFGRRDLIAPLKDLAQFSQYFEYCESILYAMAKYEVETPYVNNSTAAWCEWFRPYFDFTIYPYQERLHILRRRLQSEPRVLIPLLSKITANLFPHTGMGIPAAIVGGKAAPQSLHDNKIYFAPCRIAVEQFPEIITSALKVATEEERELLSKAFAESLHRWLSFSGDTDGILKVLLSENFSTTELQNSELSLKRTLTLQDFREKAQNEQGKKDQEENSVYYERVKLLIEHISKPDDLSELAFLLKDDFIFHANAKLSESALRLGERIASDALLFSKALEKFSDKTNHGGFQLAKLYAPLFSYDQRQAILQRLSQSEGSQFLYAFIYEVSSGDQDFKSSAISVAHSIKKSNWVVAVNLLDKLDPASGYKFQAELVESGVLPVSILARTYLRGEEVYQDELWDLIEVVKNKMVNGDSVASSACLHIANELFRIVKTDERVIDLALISLSMSLGEREVMSDYEWKELALQLVDTAPDQVISIAVSGELSEYTAPAQFLAEIADTYGMKILVSLEPRFADAYEPPYLLPGSLENVLSNVRTEVFQEWLVQQSDKVLGNLAGHLPTPKSAGEIAEYPENTLSFWRHVPKSSAIFAKALDEFTSNSLSFGWTGYGEELFSSQADLGSRSMTHELDGIREWGRILKSSATSHLADAQKKRLTDKAREDTRNQ